MRFVWVLLTVSLCPTALAEQLTCDDGYTVPAVANSQTVDLIRQIEQLAETGYEANSQNSSKVVPFRTKSPAEMDRYIFCTTAAESPAKSRRSDPPYANYVANRAWIETTEKGFEIPQGFLSCLYMRETNYRSDIIDGQTISSAKAFSMAQFVDSAHEDLIKHFSRVEANLSSPVTTSAQSTPVTSPAHANDWARDRIARIAGLPSTPVTNAKLQAARNDPTQKQLVKKTVSLNATNNSPVQVTSQKLSALLTSLNTNRLKFDRQTLKKGGALRSAKLPDSAVARPNRALERPEAIVGGATWLRYYYQKLFGDLPSPSNESEKIRRFLLAGAAYNAGDGNFLKYCTDQDTVLQCFRNLPGFLGETKRYIRSMHNCTQGGCTDSIVPGTAYTSRMHANGSSCANYKSIDKSGCPSSCGFFPGACEELPIARTKPKAKAKAATPAKSRPKGKKK